MRTFKQYLEEAYDFAIQSDRDIDSLKWESNYIESLKKLLAHLQSVYPHVEIPLVADKGKGLFKIRVPRTEKKDIESWIANMEGSESLKGSQGGPKWDFGSGSFKKEGPSGAEWESVITYHFNDKQGDATADVSASTIAGKFSAYADSGKSLAKAFHAKLNPDLSVYMKQSGAAGGKANLSDDWIKWGGVEGTPKTDMYTYTGNDDNVVHAISLKKSGGSQIASGAKGETISTFKAALEHLGGSASKYGVDGLMEQIEKNFNKLTTEFTATELLKIDKEKDGWRKHKPKDWDVLDQFLATEKFHKEFNVTLAETLNSNISKSKVFKEAYLFEALSGTKKFKVEKCRASVCIEFDPSSGTIKHYTPITKNGTFESISTKLNPDEKLPISNEIKTLAKGCKIYSAWKSGKGSPYSALRIGAGMRTNSYNYTTESESTPFRDMIRNEIINDGIVQVMLNEEIDQLDEFRIIKKVFNKMKDLGKNAIKWVTGLLEKIAAKLAQKLNELKKLGSRFFKGLFDFFGIELKNVSASVPKQIKGFI